MGRNVLLIEPDYTNKYPPLGLMKLATYHKQLGDQVRFFKGDLRELIITDIAASALQKYTCIDNTISWQDYYDPIKDHIKFGKRNDALEDRVKNSPYFFTLNQWFDYYRRYYSNEEYKKYPKWDRICITTLFTFYWKKTIDTIEIAKTLIKNQKELFIGGILATVLPEELEKETGIKPIRGLLDKPGILDKNNPIIIDTLPLDYSILFEIDYKYEADNAFYAYTTRGCPNHCSFCAVPTLEPVFNHYISIADTLTQVKAVYGDKPDLLLLDNNVLASEKFPTIIADIKACGFEKGSQFKHPNYLEIYIKQLERGLNDYGFIRAVFEQYKELLKKLKGAEQQEVYNILRDAKLLKIHTITKAAAIRVYPKIKDYYEKHQNQVKSRRAVDFNQGLDASLLTEEKVQLLSEIAIRPLRIAFDSLKDDKEAYLKAVHLCRQYGITSFSNYLLYNYRDTPEELYKRIKINVMRCEKLSVSIYSFPMKYHPISGEYSKNRDYMGKHWNRKYIRAVQTILNATKGKIGPGKSFFYKAFGKTIEEFTQLLLMPEIYLLHRLFFEDLGYTQKWQEDFKKLNTSEKHELMGYIKDNKFDTATYKKITNKNIQEVYAHYLLNRDDISDKTTEIGKLKTEYDRSKKNEGFGESGLPNGGFF